MGQCKDIMTKNPSCCLANDTAERAAQIMKSENVGSIPVIEENEMKKLLGMVTDRDIVLKIVAEGKDPKETPLAKIMAEDPVRCQADDDLADVYIAMCDHQIRRIPVVDGEGCVVGIIAQADVAVRTEEPENTGVVVKEISKTNVGEKELLKGGVHD